MALSVYEVGSAKIALLPAACRGRPAANRAKIALAETAPRVPLRACVTPLSAAKKVERSAAAALSPAGHVLGLNAGLTVDASFLGILKSCVWSSPLRHIGLDKTMDAQFACNFKDARNFAVVTHLHSEPSWHETNAIQQWICTALSTHCCTHAAAYDTYTRSQFAWDVRADGFRSSKEVWVLIRLRWEGRRYMDSANLVFVRDYPRPPPVMNASEIWRALTQSTFCIPPGIESCGVSGLANKVFARYWEQASSPTWQLSNVSYMWKQRKSKSEEAPYALEEEWVEEPV